MKQYCFQYDFSLPSPTPAERTQSRANSFKCPPKGLFTAYYDLAYSCEALKRQCRQECHLHVNDIVDGACARSYRRVSAHTPAPAVPAAPAPAAARPGP